jgi:hypothetical protein
MSKRIAGMFVIILAVLISARIVLAQPNEPHAGNAMWIEPSTIDLSSQSLGYTFNVTVYANITSVPGAHGIGGWQFLLLYNTSQLNATGRIWYANLTAGKSELFDGIPVTLVAAVFDHVGGSVLDGEVWAGNPTNGPFAYTPRMGALTIVEFNYTGGLQVVNFTSSLNISSSWPSDTYVLDYDDVSDVLANVYNATVIPEFPIAAYLVTALIAISTISLLAKKSLKKPK